MKTETDVHDEFTDTTRSTTTDAETGTTLDDDKLSTPSANVMQHENIKIELKEETFESSLQNTTTESANFIQHRNIELKEETLEKSLQNILTQPQASESQETKCSDVIDLTDDTVEVHSKVRFSDKKKKKKKKKQKKREKDQEREISAGAESGGHASVGNNLVDCDADNDFIIVENVNFQATENQSINEAARADQGDFALSLTSVSGRSGRRKKVVNYNENVFSTGDSKLWMCELCDACFESVEELLQHTAVHPEKVDYSHVCNDCGKGFDTIFGLHIHERKTHGIVRSHNCSKCSQPFASFVALKKHKKACKGDQAHSSNVESQKVKVLKEKRYCCSDCGKLFSTAGHLNVHEKRHKDGIIKSSRSILASLIPANLQCHHSGCTLQLPNLRAYKRHVKTHGTSRPYPCPQCKRFFSEWGNMVRHLKLHFDIKGHECPECGKKFSEASSVRSHMRHIHTGERPYRCEQCPKAFATKSDLTRHYLKHSNERKYECPDCGKKFKQYSALVIHIRKKAGERPWKCGVCAKSFASKGGLMMHMVQHSKMKLYECDRCKKQFSYLASIKAHMRTHTGEFPYSCKICGKRFAFLSNKNRHQRTVHA